MTLKWEARARYSAWGLHVDTRSEVIALLVLTALRQRLRIGLCIMRLDDSGTERRCNALQLEGVCRDDLLSLYRGRTLRSLSKPYRSHRQLLDQTLLAAQRIVLQPLCKVYLCVRLIAHVCLLNDTTSSDTTTSVCPNPPSVTSAHRNLLATCGCL